jgi:hypothetical protein
MKAENLPVDIIKEGIRLYKQGVFHEVNSASMKAIKKEAERTKDRNSSLYEINRHAEEETQIAAW